MTVRNCRVSTEPGVQAGLTDFFSRAGLMWGIAALLMACSSPAPAPPPQTPTPVPAPPLPPPAPSTPSRWAIATATAPAAYAVETRATFSTRADTLARSDTSVSRTTLRVVPRGAALDVTISAFSINSSYSQPLALTAPSRAVGRFDANGAIAFEGPGQSSCTALTSAAFESTRDLWVKWPSEVTAGTRWRDSTTITACRDGIPLRINLVRSYHVTTVANDSTRLVTVERTSRVALSGRGALRGDTVTMSGEGSGSAILHVAAQTGWLRDGAGSSVLQLRAAGKTRTQIVDQRVEFTALQSDPGR